ncbi:MAG: PIN domain-containing protein [Candidatus Caldarchaeum sp.]|nr:PIN domain-containing protein [Candidatus Caldarchaeum sp.]MDW7978110.1 PIN domain-containing protein [Candidatus Caldarchaeum sp.]
MHLIDTNIFLEVLLGREKSGECKQFKLVRDGKINAIMTDFSVHSIIVVLDGFKKLEALKTFLTRLTAYKGLRVYYTTLADEVKAAEIELTSGLDMDDAIQYSAALSNKAESIVSFDKHFDGLKTPRNEPKNLLK